MHPNIISGANRYTHELVTMRARWVHDARPNQLPPPGDWRIWAAIAGRGWGKTRVGVEHTLYNALSNPGTRHAVVAPTQSDCRSVCFEGESGLLEKCPKFFRSKRDYSSTDLELWLPNGSLIAGKSAERPDRLRGPQWHGAWCDEVASWGARIDNGKQSEGPGLKDAWSNLDFGLRLGKHPRVVVTTTPRPIKFIRDLVKDPAVAVSTGSVFENAANLAASALESFTKVYEGTRLGRQELYGDVLSENDNALWKGSQFDRPGFRVRAAPQLARVVVAIDPAVTTSDDSDETGIIVAGLGEDGRVYILHDASGVMRPLEWAHMALALYRRYSANAIVGETNQGGDLIESNLLTVAEGEPFMFKGIHAKKGKYLRAEPVAAYYEKEKVSHVGRFDKLESQMCDFVGSLTNGSPDRLDAAVYAVTELVLGTVKHAFW